MHPRCTQANNQKRTLHQRVCNTGHRLLRWPSSVHALIQRTLPENLCAISGAKCNQWM